jgi:hypothetical protein
MLGQFRGVGIGGDQAFHGLGYELGQVVFNPAQLVDLLVDRLLELQGGS